MRLIPFLTLSVLFISCNDSISLKDEASSSNSANFINEQFSSDPLSNGWRAYEVMNDPFDLANDCINLRHQNVKLLNTSLANSNYDITTNITTAVSSGGGGSFGIIASNNSAQIDSMSYAFAETGSKTLSITSSPVDEISFGGGGGGNFGWCLADVDVSSSATSIINVSFRKENLDTNFSFDFSSSFLSWNSSSNFLDIAPRGIIQKNLDSTLKAGQYKITIDLFHDGTCPLYGGGTFNMDLFSAKHSFTEDRIENDLFNIDCSSSLNGTVEETISVSSDIESLILRFDAITGGASFEIRSLQIEPL